MYIVYPVLLEVSTKVETLESRSRVDTQYRVLRDSRNFKSVFLIIKSRLIVMIRDLRVSTLGNTDH